MSIVVVSRLISISNHGWAGSLLTRYQVASSTGSHCQVYDVEVAVQVTFGFPAGAVRQALLPEGPLSHPSALPACT